MFLTLVLVRHGEIDSNLRQVYSGRSDEPLNATGRQQALQVGQALVGQGVSALFSSPILRARQTAEIISGLTGVKTDISGAFTELGMGPWEGLNESEVAQHYPEAWKIWTERPAGLVLPGRERLEEVRVRILEGLQGIVDSAKETSALVVIVSHVAIIRVLLMHARKMDLNLYKSINIPNAIPTRITLHADDFTETR